MRRRLGGMWKRWPVRWGTEAAVGEDVVRRLLEVAESPRSSPGGSSFNALYALAHTGLNLSLGCLGVAGTSPGEAVSPVQELRRVGVDVDAVGSSPRLPGTCLALEHQGERTLFTHIGANVDAAEHFRRNFRQLARWLRQARVIHVTSFLDPQTPGVLLRLLQELRRAEPGVLITLDPGHVWCADPTPQILGLVGLADHLLLNQAEHRLLAGHLADHPGTVLVKLPDGVEVHRPAGVVRVPQKALAPGEIIDSTGAGDVFAAGLLAMLVAGSPGARTTDDAVLRGAELGLAMARHKLQHQATAGHPGFGLLAGRLAG